MPNAFEILELPPEATDEQVRQAYLNLVRRFPPEQHPERFAAVRAAYEKLKDLDARTRYRLFELGGEESIETLIEEVTCRMLRRRFGLSQLLTITAPPRR